MRAGSIVLYIISIVFVIYGLVTMFTYGDADSGNYTGHIVGGDAYNYIIIGVRGVGLIGVGVVSALVGTGLLVTHAVIDAKHEILFESSRYKQALNSIVESREKTTQQL